MIGRSIIISAVFGVPSHTGWTLVTSEGPTTTHYTQTKYAYGNGTSNQIPVPTVNVSYLKQYQSVTGSVTDGPNWPSWLTPLHFLENLVTTTVPTHGDPYMLNPGKTYTCDHVYDRQTGYQQWSFSESLAMDIEGLTDRLNLLDVTAERTRVWYYNSELSEYEQ